MKPVAILGSGPAGLLAAHATGLLGKPFAIFSQPDRHGNPLKSQLGGAQFLHKPIPELTTQEPDAEVTFRVRGDEAVYRDKVYGEERVPFTSFEGVHDGMTQPAWNLLKLYDWLWDDLLSCIAGNLVKVTPEWIDANSSDFEYVLNTIPLPAICRSQAGLIDDHHAFRMQQVFIHTEAIGQVMDNTIVYNGTRDQAWYRMSRIFGVGGTEWSDQVGRPPVYYITARKPIRTSCDCFPDVYRLGRFGEWKKGVLTHDAFLGALRAAKDHA